MIPPHKPDAPVLKLRSCPSATGLTGPHPACRGGAEVRRDGRKHFRLSYPTGLRTLAPPRQAGWGPSRFGHWWSGYEPSLHPGKRGGGPADFVHGDSDLLEFLLPAFPGVVATLS